MPAEAVSSPCLLCLPLRSTSSDTSASRGILEKVRSRSMKASECLVIASLKAGQEQSRRGLQTLCHPTRNATSAGDLCWEIDSYSESPHGESGLIALTCHGAHAARYHREHLCRRALWGFLARGRQAPIVPFAWLSLDAGALRHDSSQSISNLLGGRCQTPLKLASCSSTPKALR
jgi:hypothetical protein